MDHQNQMQQQRVDDIQDGDRILASNRKQSTETLDPIDYASAGEMDKRLMNGSESVINQIALQWHNEVKCFISKEEKFVRITLTYIEKVRKITTYKSF